MKARIHLSANELDALRAMLERRLEGVGLRTQPEVAARIVDLVGDPSAGLRHFADAIKVDPALSGRLLKVANSAFFAQRQPVTSVERACVLLGLERLKGVSLGFYMSRSAEAGDASAELSRRVWGQSVYRACLAAELARSISPLHAPEAFVVGLMMDAGTPILAEWLGAPAREIVEADEDPTASFGREMAALEYTHVDVLAALCRAWRLPPTLAKPLERHHTPPPPPGRGSASLEAVPTLHRIGFYVGALRLRPSGVPASTVPVDEPAGQLMGLGPAALSAATRRAAVEYSAMREMFADVAASLGDLHAVVEGAHRQLVGFVDGAVLRELEGEARSVGERLAIGGSFVDVRSGGPGLVTAVLVGADGGPLVVHTFDPDDETPRQTLATLGIDDPDPAQADAFGRCVRLMAA